MNFDTISTKPEKSLSGKLSEILGTISKKAKTDQQEDEIVPQLDGMIDIQEEKPQNKKESVGNSRQKDSGKRTSAKIREKESSKSKETLQETLNRLKEERDSSKNEKNIQEKSKETLQETLKRLREERDSSKSKEKQVSTKNKEREPSTSSKEKTKSTKEYVSKEEKKSSNQGKDSKNERSRSRSSSKHSQKNSSKSSSAKDSKEENKSSNNDKDSKNERSRSSSSSKHSKSSSSLSTKLSAKVQEKSSKSRGSRKSCDGNGSEEEWFKQKEKSVKPEKDKVPSPPKRSRLSGKQAEAAAKRKSQMSNSQPGTKSDYFTRTNSDSESDFDPESRKRKTPKQKSPAKKSKPKAHKAKAQKDKGLPYWCEVYVTNSGWVPVDVDQGRVNCADEMEERCGIKPMLYVVAINADGTFKDVTR